MIKNTHTHTNKEGDNNEFGFHFNCSVCFHYQIYMHTFTFCFTSLFQCNLSSCQIVLRTLVIHERFISGKTVFVHVDVGQIYNQTFLHMNMRITVNSRNKGKDKCHSLKYCYITETERLHLMKSAQWLNMNLRIHCSIN